MSMMNELKLIFLRLIYMIQNGIQIMNNYAYNLIIHCYQQSYIE